MFLAVNSQPPQALKPERYRRADQISFGIDTYAMWTMGRDSEMDASMGLGLMPVREIFKQAGREPLYELVRLFHAFNIYDLVVPITVVSQMPQLPTEPGLLKIGLQAMGLAKRKLITPDLIIPRIRRLLEGNPNEIIHELEVEVEKADEDMVKLSRLPMRKHEVTDHRRDLPPGRKASAAAIARARAADMPLAANQTFVKKHERGKGEKIGLPRARRRTK